MFENIESYACLPLLAKTAKTIDVLLAITNALGQQAHQHWQEKLHQSRGVDRGVC